MNSGTPIRLMVLILVAVWAGAGCVQRSAPYRQVAYRAGAVPYASEDELNRQAKASAHFGTAVSLALQEDVEGALKEFERALAARPGDALLVEEVARRMLQAEEPERALRALEQGRRAGAESGEIFNLLGVAYGQLGRPKEALKFQRQAVDRLPGNVGAWQNLAGLHLRQGDTNAAVATLDRAAGLTNAEPSFAIGVASLITQYAGAGVVPAEKAQGQVQRLLGRVEGMGLRPEMRIQAAELYFRNELLDAAEPLYKSLLRWADDPTPIHRNLAQIYLATDRRGQALEHLEAVAEENPTNLQPYIFLASLAMEEEQFERAAEYLSKVLLLNPEFEQGHQELAGLYITTDQPREALRALEKARNRFPRSFLLEFYTGIAHAMLGQWPEAVQHYVSAEIIAKTEEEVRLNKNFHFQLGSAYERNGNYEEAAEQFEKALELDPDFAEALNYLGYMWAEQGVHLEKAHRYIDRAVEAEPENAAFLDSLGWVLFKLDKPQEALPYLEKAIELSEEPDPTLYDHLGDVQAALGDWGQARKAWETAVPLSESDPELKEKLKSKLEQAERAKASKAER